MRWLHKLLMRCKMLFRRGRAGEELQEELQFHLDQQIAENIAAGMAAEEARSAALRSFGNPLRCATRRAIRGAGSGSNCCSATCFYGIRTLVRTPGFSVLAILVMGLGIGANVALFTVVRSVLLKPLPFHRPGSAGETLRGKWADGAFQDNVRRRAVRLLRGGRRRKASRNGN